MKKLILIIFLVIGCTIPAKINFQVPSKIFIYAGSTTGEHSYLYYDGKKIDFGISQDKWAEDKIDRYSSAPIWLHKQDLLLIDISVRTDVKTFGIHSYSIDGKIVLEKPRVTLYRHSCLFDLNGNIVDTLYSLPLTKSEDVFQDIVLCKNYDSVENFKFYKRGTGGISFLAISPNDSILLCKGGGPNVDFLIWDFNKRKTVDTISNFTSFTGNSIFDANYIRQYMFAPNSKQFVYWTGDSSPKGNKIFIYDIEYKSHKQICNEGYSPVWSSKVNIIAYLFENKVWVYNVNTGKKSFFYKPKWREQIEKIIWSPSGEQIFVKTRKNNFIVPCCPTFPRRLIDINTKAITEGGELSKLGRWFYWK